MTDQDEKPEEIDPPPFFKNWSGMYKLVIGTLVVLIALFYLFSKYFE